MGTFECDTIHIPEELGASAFLFDLRNSTKIIRSISTGKRFTYHMDYMRELHKFIFSTIYGTYSTGSVEDEFAINDTGDGYLCVFWGKAHSLKCMNVATAIRNRLQKTLRDHNAKLELKNKDNELNFGFSVHTGASTVQRVHFNDKGGKLIHKDFILGILPNSVARLESLNKLYTEFNFVASGNYKRCFTKHAEEIRNTPLIGLFDPKNKFVYKSNGKIFINDGKKSGHYVYTIDKSFFEEFQRQYK